MAGKTVIRQQGESEALWMLGGLYEVVVSADDSGGAMTVMKITVPEGGGPPPHVHDSEEVVTVLQGRARYHIAGQTTEIGTGSTVYLPAGTEETFEPVGGPVSVLIAYTPGGIDRFFREFGEPAARREIPPPMTEPPDVQRLSALAEKHGLHIRLPVS